MLDEPQEGASGYASDTDLSAERSARRSSSSFKAKVKEVLGKEFPDDPREQLWGGIGAVFSSWNGKRAISYRRIEGIPDEWGTAVNVQAMVFGNMGDTSATGVAFTRNPATGENKFYGEWLVNAQGEDVVAGIRTPNPLNEATKNEQNKHLPSLETAMPDGLHASSTPSATTLEKHYSDMQDIEFTIQEGRLWMLQCRVGKRTGTAAAEHGHGHARREADRRARPRSCASPRRSSTSCSIPIVDPAAEKAPTPLAKGLPAGPGGACGPDRVHRRRRGGVGEAGQEGDPGPRGDEPRGRRGHARGGRHPDRPRRHDLATRRWWRAAGASAASSAPARSQVDVHAKTITRRRAQRSARATGSPSTARAATSTPASSR